VEPKEKQNAFEVGQVTCLKTYGFYFFVYFLLLERVDAYSNISFRNT